MQASAAREEWQTVRNRYCWTPGIALDQQVRLLVMVAHEAHRGGVTFVENDMSGELKSGLPPRGNETVGLVTAIEADAITVVFQQAKDFREGRIDPAVIVVIRDGSPGTVTVVRDVGRIGQHEIDAGGLEP